MQIFRDSTVENEKLLLKTKASGAKIATTSTAGKGAFIMIWNEKRENAYCEITPALLALKEQWEKKNYASANKGFY